MGQNQSNISDGKEDLKDSSDLALEQRAILIVFKLAYIINDGEIINNLDTGNEILNIELEKKILNLTGSIKQLFLQKYKLNILACMLQNYVFHITVEKLDQSIFDLNDCLIIRQSLNNYNQYNEAFDIINEDEANATLFYEDLGPIKLGLIVDTIDYI